MRVLQLVMLEIYAAPLAVFKSQNFWDDYAI